MLLSWREEKRREGKGREEKGREEQEQETQAISSRDYTEEERRAHRMIAPKQKGEKHQSAGEEQERNKEGNNIKDVITRVKEPGPYSMC